MGEGHEVGAMASLAANIGVGAMWAKQILDNWDEWEDKEQAKDELEEEEEMDEMGITDSEWIGDNLEVRLANTGLRVGCLNIQRKLLTHEGEVPYIDLVMAEFHRLKIDILVLQEPGKIEGRSEMIKYAMMESSKESACGCEVAIFPGKGSSGGCVVVMSAAWAAVSTDRFVEGNEGRCIFMEFVAAERVVGEPLHRLLLAAPYGYNDGALPQHRSHGLREACGKRIKAYRKKYHTASAVILGDLNAAQDSALDTDRGGTGREPDAAIIDGFIGMGLDDVFREHYPSTQAITHKAIGGNDDATGRRLDYILATREVVDHSSTRIGIYCPRVSTDHRMVVMDTALNCADAAGQHIPVWPQRKVSRLLTVHEPDEEQTTAFNDALASAYLP